MAKPLNKRRFYSIWLLIIVSVVFIGVKGWQAYAKSEEQDRLQPVQQMNQLIKDMENFRRSKFGYPASVGVLNETIWKKDGRAKYQVNEAVGYWVNRNYAYYYSPVSSQLAVVWAVPVGPRRNEGNTYFLIFNDKAVRYWKGPALSIADAEACVKEKAPTHQRLFQLGLVEQPEINFKK